MIEKPQPKQKILVTGAFGFLGSNFVRNTIYKKMPYTIVSLDKAHDQNLLNNIYVNPLHPFYLIDLTDPIITKNVFAIEKPDYVIHFADECSSDNIRTLHNNIVSTQSVIEASQSVKRIFYISTGKMYYNANSYDPQVFTTFNISKISSEMIVKSSRVPSTIIRPCNIFGPRQQKNRLVPYIIKCLLNKESPTLYNNGCNQRDWLSTHDLSEFIIHLISNNINEKIINFSYEYSLTSLEILNKISKIMAVKDLDVKFVKNASQQNRSIPKTDLEKLGFTPKSFSYSLENTVDWYTKNAWYFT